MSFVSDNHRFDEERCCGGKKGYLTWKEAADAVKRSRRRGTIENNTLHPYRCPFCPFIHIGHGNKEAYK